MNSVEEEAQSLRDEVSDNRVQSDTTSSESETTNRPHTVLIDGSHLFYKAFHSQTFNPTKGAIYGLTRILMKVMQDLKPYDYIGI